ncbi:MAG: hypothetical protein MR598_07410 [Erysipelotrichaceae bacterium]|nr:hypothetical protein [Erysipelotrichaceae bacterium]
MNKLKKEKLKEIPTKNYIYLFIILLGSILFLIYIYTWYETYNETRLKTSIMNNYLTVINYNELDNYISENQNAVIYVSVLGNEEINRFEKNLKNEVVNHNLRNSILYLDLTNEDIKQATQKLKIDENFPYLVVYTNGRITDTYSIVENDYSSKKLVKYLNRIGATEND